MKLLIFLLAYLATTSVAWCQVTTRTAACTTPSGNFTYSINNKTVAFTNSVIDATTWKWDFGDGNTSTTKEPTHNYPAYGRFNVCLTAFSDCSQALICNTIKIEEPVVVTGTEGVIENTVAVFPNPVNNQLIISFHGAIPSRIMMINPLGEAVLSLGSEEFVSPVSLNLSGEAPGVYQLVWEVAGAIHSRRIIKGID